MAEPEDFKPFAPRNGNRRFNLRWNGVLFKENANAVEMLVESLRKIFDENVVADEQFDMFRNDTLGTRYRLGSRRLLSTKDEIDEKIRQSANPEREASRYRDEAFEHAGTSYRTHTQIGDMSIVLMGWLNYDFGSEDGTSGLRIEPANFNIPPVLKRIEWNDFRNFTVNDEDVRQYGNGGTVVASTEGLNEQASAQNHGDTEAGKASTSKEKYNRIVFGAPGTGKSHRLNEEAKKSFADANSERVTFYATYSYAQFVGTYKPVMKGEGANEKIAYQFVPGPFLRTLVKALNRPEENFLLIIEEINRANAAAVFGDVFQLLDRGVDGVSEYSIAASEDVKKYLEKVLTEGGKQTLAKLSGSMDMLKIPANLYLWATMNSADQGVFPLDTAFKRRWSFEYIGIDDGEDDAANLTIAGGGTGGYEWKKLRKFLNGLLTEYGVNEDKLMGPFFLKDASEFGSKVLMYLWEDAARMCRRAFFGEKIKTYSDLLKGWQKKGVGIFKEQKSVREGALKNSYEDILPQSGADANDTNS